MKDGWTKSCLKKFFGFMVIMIFFIVGPMGCGQLSTTYADRLEVNNKAQEEYIGQFKDTHTLLQKGEYRKALSLINKHLEKSRAVEEKAILHYLRGLAYLNLKENHLALADFQATLGQSSLNSTLKNVVQVKMVGLLMTQGQQQKALELSQKIDEGLLPGAIYYEYYFQVYQMALEKSDRKLALKALTHYLGQYQTLSALKSSHYLVNLETLFSDLSYQQKMEFIGNFRSPAILCVGHLIYLEAEKAKLSQATEESHKYLDILRYDFSQYLDLMHLADSLLQRERTISAGVVQKIGIILPLSQQKKKFGELALQGLLMGLKYYEGEGSTPGQGTATVTPAGSTVDGSSEVSVITGENGGSTGIKSGYRRLTYVIRDSGASGVKGSYAIKELAEKENISIFIGGLFPEEAAEEYLMAKKLGKVFISLANVFVPRNEKDLQLFEIEGSVESQIEALFKWGNSGQLGKKMAILYPDDRRGKMYLEEFWDRNEFFDLVEVESYKKNLKDYRDVVGKMLSLSYVRERQEEFAILNDIYSKDKRGIRRVQVLTPILNYDWIYVPGLPQEVIKILPIFHYFDANALKFVGGPSWRGRWLKDKLSMKGLYSLGSDLLPFKEKVQTQLNLKDVGLVELKMIEAMGLAKELTSDHWQVGSDREGSLSTLLSDQKAIKTAISSWVAKDKLWIKDNVDLQEL